MAGSPEIRQRMCIACGRTIGWDVNVCPHCGEDYRPKMAGQQLTLQVTGTRFQGDLLLLIILLIIFFPAGIIYYFIKRE